MRTRFVARPNVADIRLLRSADPRITCQMLDLARYQQVSSMPPVTRDLSVAVPDDDDEETLGGRVRDALGADTSCVELPARHAGQAAAPGQPAVRILECGFLHARTRLPAGAYMPSP
jgi:hypothetical protein